MMSSTNLLREKNRQQKRLWPFFGKESENDTARAGENPKHI